MQCALRTIYYPRKGREKRNSTIDIYWIYCFTYTSPNSTFTQSYHNQKRNIFLTTSVSEDRTSWITTLKVESLFPIRKNKQGTKPEDIRDYTNTNRLYNRSIFIFRKERQCKYLGYFSIRGLPSLASTKRPPSPLEIRRSLSRYVVRSHDFVRSPGMGTFKGGWPEIARTTPTTASCRGLRDCCRGDKLILCPNISTFSGRSMLDLITGGWSVPSLNSTCKILLKT